jgi:hypothetical protein
MKKLAALTISLLMVFQLSFPAEKIKKPVLSFNDKGKFKIVQFTDIHYQANSYRSDSALILVKKVITREKPDLVVFTGDIVISRDRRQGWLSLSRVMSDARTPWAVALGNHDGEGELNGEQIMDLLESLPYNLTENGPEKISGNGNYVLKIRSSGSPKTAALLYFFDSHGSFPGRKTGTWDYIKSDQINWYRKQSSTLTRHNGGEPFPSLAFFHIPLTEYREIKNTAVGLHTETITPPEFNSGMFTAMYEAKDIMGVFAGHNHNNNFIGCYNNICLGFGNTSGRESYGDIGRGARVIELYEGERKFDTWILKLYDCDRRKDTWIPVSNFGPEFFVTYPDSFIQLKEAGEEYIEFKKESVK